MNQLLFCLFSDIVNIAIIVFQHQTYNTFSKLKGDDIIQLYDLTVYDILMKIFNSVVFSVSSGLVLLTGINNNNFHAHNLTLFAMISLYEIILLFTFHDIYYEFLLRKSLTVMKDKYDLDYNLFYSLLKKCKMFIFPIYQFESELTGRKRECKDHHHDNITIVLINEFGAKLGAYSDVLLWKNNNYIANFPQYYTDFNY